jgi:hypothetical protein
MVPSDDEPVFDFLTEDVTAPLGEEWEEMTFPSYQHLLRLVGTGNADAMGVRPVASVAKSGSRPIGLAIAELPTSARPTAELLSIFVAEMFAVEASARRCSHRLKPISLVAA